MTGRPARRLYDTPPFAIDYLDGAGSDLVIAFSSIGHDPSRPPSPEFVATATGRGTGRGNGPNPRRALFVMDANRSWASDPGFAAALLHAVETVRAMGPISRIACIGLSMGGVAALAAMQILPIDATLAFGPQRSPLLPGETRWADWTARLDRLDPDGGGRRRLVAPLPGAGQGWACLFHGMLDDTAQAMAFPLSPGTDHFLFADQSHSSLVPHLKARGVLAGLMEAALAGDRRRLIRIAVAAGGVRRRPG